MVRYAAFLIVGAMIGAGFVLSLPGSDNPPSGSAAPSVADSGAPSADGSTAETASAGLSPAARFVREANRIEALAERSPEAAIAQAMTQSGDSLRRMLLIRAGEGAARRDPIAALAQAAAIDDLELRSGLTLGILNAWAALDPAGMLEYLATADPNYIRAPAPFDRLVVGDPQAVLSRLDDFERPIRQSLEQAALLALAETDAVGTLARLDAMPPGQDRTRLMRAVAETYGRQDPDAALAWVASLSPPSQEALTGVVSGMASADINRAIDWVLRELDAPTLSGVDPAEALPVVAIFQALRSGAMPMPATADRLLLAGNPTLKSRATSALMVWAQQNASEAVNFAVERLDRLQPDDLTTLAMQTGQSAPEIAVQTTDRLPPEYRVAWVAGVADVLVRTRPQLALDYLAGQRGQPGYEEGVLRAVRQLAPADPATAAMLVTESMPSPRIANAAQIVASSWASRDPGAARQWVLGMPSGEARDAGITGVLTSVTAAGEFDPSLLDAMSSYASRERAASGAILQIGRTDPAQARELIATYVTDPAQRAQLEQRLEQQAQSGAAGANMPRLPTINFGQ